MKKNIGWIFLLALSTALIFLTISSSESSTKAKTKLKATLGKQLYDDNCLICHGTLGKGTDTAPNIRRKSLSDFMEVLTGGKNSEGGESEKETESGEGSMPSFDFTREEVIAIKYYLMHPKQAGTGNTTTTTDTNTSSTTTTIQTTPTYTNDIKAILDINCVSCHGGIVTPNLSTYANAFAKKDRIKAKVDSGTMPPSGSLNASDIATIDAWVAAGGPQ